MTKKVKKEALPAVQKAGQLPEVPQGNWGMQATSSKDIIIPKILTMQAMSKLVTAGTARMGEFVESLNNTKLGDETHPVEFLPFAVKPTWVVFEEKNGDLKYSKQVDIVPENDSWPYEETLNGVKIRRDRTLNIYCLLPAEIKEGNYFPYMLSFRRTSMQAGRKLVTAFAKLAMFNRPPAAEVYDLSCARQTNLKGTFLVSDVKKKRDSTPDEVAAAFQWFQTVMAGSVKVDDSDLEEESTGSYREAPGSVEEF